jgi:hypothetical protein
VVQDALDLLTGVTRRFLVFAALAITLAAPPRVFAQSAADHAALAHGKPIVNSHPVQPTPDVVDERLRHHEEMLQAKRHGSVRPVIGTPPAVPATQPDARRENSKP